VGRRTQAGLAAFPLPSPLALRWLWLSSALSFDHHSALDSRTLATRMCNILVGNWPGFYRYFGPQWKSWLRRTPHPQHLGLASTGFNRIQGLDAFTLWFSLRWPRHRCSLESSSGQNWMTTRAQQPVVHQMEMIRNPIRTAMVGLPSNAHTEPSFGTAWSRIPASRAAGAGWKTPSAQRCRSANRRTDFGGFGDGAACGPCSRRQWSSRSATPAARW